MLWHRLTHRHYEAIHPKGIGRLNYCASRVTRRIRRIVFTPTHEHAMYEVPLTSEAISRLSAAPDSQSAVTTLAQMWLDQNRAALSAR